MLELYHHGSSVCAAKVRFALAEKRLQWTGHYLDLLKGEQFTPEFLSINPKTVVPVLIHDDEIAPESTVICEYVEEVFSDHPSPLWVISCRGIVELACLLYPRKLPQLSPADASAKGHQKQTSLWSGFDLQ
jgi:glutathione S-transferase